MIEILINGKRVMYLKDAKSYTAVESRYHGQCVDVGVDQSKSHTAIVVGPPNVGYTDYIEILGGGGDTDVLDVCAVTRRFMFDIFKGATFRVIGVEDPITKQEYRDAKGQKKMTGMDTHENRIKLTSIFANFMFIFYDLAGFHPDRVNNNDWKFGILPEEYRKKTHKKGSLDWHKDRKTPLALTNDNVTDAACILDFVRKTRKDVVTTMPILGAELPKGKYVYIIRDLGDKFNGVAVYQYNNTISFEDNLAFARNRIKGDSASVKVVPVESVPIEEFYKDNCKLHNPNASAVMVIVGGA